MIDAHGRVRQVSDLGERVVLTADVALRTGRTPYTRFGDVPVLLLAVAALATAWFTSRRGA